MAIIADGGSIIKDNTVITTFTTFNEAGTQQNADVTPTIEVIRGGAVVMVEKTAVGVVNPTAGVYKYYINTDEDSPDGGPYLEGEYVVKWRGTVESIDAAEKQSFVLID